MVATGDIWERHEVLRELERGMVHITHFGFGRLFQLGADEAIREPHYAAPELLSGGRIGRRTDVYGFGLVMYELLLRREFSFEEEILPLSPTTMAPRDPSGIPMELQCMIKRALEEDPRRRQPSVEKMLAFLIPFARAREELGGPPDAPQEHLFAEPSGSRRKPRGAAPILGKDGGEPSAAGEQEGWPGESPPPLPSVPPETL
jgi:eukaryotic-like serine/threonine-protein kinase